MPLLAPVTTATLFCNIILHYRIREFVRRFVRSKLAEVGISYDQSSPWQKLAVRRAGELMLKQVKAAGTRANLVGRDSSGGAIVAPPEKKEPTLAQQGISKRQASDWQAVARVPEQQ